jgi:hypothetical protein
MKLIDALIELKLSPNIEVVDGEVLITLTRGNDNLTFTIGDTASISFTNNNTIEYTAVKKALFEIGKYAELFSIKTQVIDDMVEITISDNGNSISNRFCPSRVRDISSMVHSLIVSMTETLDRKQQEASPCL